MEHREPMPRRTILHWLMLSPAAAVGWLAALASESPTRAHAEVLGAGRCVPTGADVEGPFYLPGAPHRVALAPPEEPGVRLVVRGRIVGPDCTTPVPGALLDLWQADTNGESSRSARDPTGSADGSGRRTSISPSLVPGISH